MKLEFEGPFRDSIAEHIRLKQSLGYNLKVALWSPEIRGNF